MISKEEYNRLANDGFNIIPLIKDLNIELDSPISLYSSIKDKKMEPNPCINSTCLRQNLDLGLHSILGVKFSFGSSEIVFLVL